MAITTINGIIGGTKQRVSYYKTTSRTALSNIWFTVHDTAGNPGAATFAVGNTANGVVPTDATAGYPIVNFSSGKGYLHSFTYLNTSSNTRAMLYDRLFHAGEFAYSAGTSTLTSQPSYSGRVPNSSYSGTQIWIEVSTAFATGNNWSVVVTYTDQSGNTGASTATMTAMNAAALIKGACYQLPLAPGDSGVSKIESVVVTNGVTAMTAGGFNVFVARPLFWSRNDALCHGMEDTCMPELFGDSALGIMLSGDPASTGVPQAFYCIVSG